MTDTAERPPASKAVARPDVTGWTEAWLDTVVSPFGWPTLRRLPRVEETDEDGTWTVRVELPGVKAADIEVGVLDGVLEVHAERRQEHRTPTRSEFQYGSTTRRLRLPAGADLEATTAASRDGVLTIRVPRPQRERARAVPVDDGAGVAHENASPISTHVPDDAPEPAARDVAGRQTPA